MVIGHSTRDFNKGKECESPHLIERVLVVLPYHLSHSIFGSTRGKLWTSELVIRSIGENVGPVGRSGPW